MRKGKDESGNIMRAALLRLLAAILAGELASTANPFHVPAVVEGLKALAAADGHSEWLDAVEIALQERAVDSGRPTSHLQPAPFGARKPSRTL